MANGKVSDEGSISYSYSLFIEFPAKIFEGSQTKFRNFDVTRHSSVEIVVTILWISKNSPDPSYLPQVDR